MPQLLIGIWAALACVGVHAAGDAEARDCDVVDEIVSICGLRKPEDLVIGPDKRNIIFSQFGEQGSLAALDTHSNSVQQLYPGANSRIATEQLWGDPSCTTPQDSFAPHGIDLSQRGDGSWQLLVVNHGGRESVEFFEIGRDAQGLLLATWRGCAMAPEQGYFNDLVALPGGGFMVTHMVDKDRQNWQLFLSFFGVDTGYVYRWDRSGGYSVVPGTEGKMPNGISVSPDGASFFVNQYFDNELRKYDMASGKLLGSVSIDKPDNLSWNPRGKLYVASQHATFLELLSSLDKKTPGPSLLPFSVFEVDPALMEKRLVLHRDGKPMGAGTVAVELDGYLYIGSYVGDRMIKVPVN